VILTVVGIILVILCSAAVIYSAEKRAYEIWSKDKDEFVLMPHVAPILWVKQTAGPKLPEHGSLDCEWKQETTVTILGEKFHYLAGYCENGVVLHLTGIDLNH